jgi:hypothetical protein
MTVLSKPSSFQIFYRVDVCEIISLICMFDKLKRLFIDGENMHNNIHEFLSRKCVDSHSSMRVVL